MELKAGFF